MEAKTKGLLVTWLGRISYSRTAEILTLRTPVRVLMRAIAAAALEEGVLSAICCGSLKLRQVSVNERKDRLWYGSSDADIH